MDKKECCVPLCRRGLLAYVYNGVSLTTSALVAGNGSYILRPCGHDLHGPTVTTFNFLPLDLADDLGYKHPVIDFTCNERKTWKQDEVRRF